MAEATAAPDLREMLKRVAGRDGVLPAAAVQQWSVRGRAPGAVVAPASASDAAAVLALCSQHGWTVQPAGGGSWLRHGRDAPAPDLVLSTRRMRGITEYVPADLTLGVLAGTPLETLRTETTAHDQFAPLDGPADLEATVGATLATASAGPMRASLGTPRDQTLGLEFVTGDGRVLRVGGRVVKNVAGYDLVRLLVGSHGALGLITAAFLRLRARPDTDVTLVLDAKLPSALFDAAHAAMPLEPASLELVYDGSGWRLLARFRGNEDAVSEARARWLTVAPDARLLDAPSAKAAWAGLHAAEAGAAVIVRARDLPTRVHDTLQHALHVAATLPSERCTLAAHATEGTVRVLFAPDGRAGDGLDAETCARFEVAIDQARHALAANGGTLHVPVPPEHASAEFDPFAADAALLPLMRTLKNALDPAGILAPGRFVV